MSHAFAKSGPDFERFDLLHQHLGELVVNLLADLVR